MTMNEKNNSELKVYTNLTDILVVYLNKINVLENMAEGLHYILKERKENIITLIINCTEDWFNKSISYLYDIQDKISSNYYLIKISDVKELDEKISYFPMISIDKKQIWENITEPIEFPIENSTKEDDWILNNPKCFYDPNLCKFSKNGVCTSELTIKDRERCDFIEDEIEN